MLMYKLWVLSAVVFLFCKFMIRAEHNRQRMVNGVFDHTKMPTPMKALAFVGFASVLCLFVFSILVVITF